MNPSLAAIPFESSILRLVAGSICISFSPVFIKLAHVGPDSAGFYRMLFAGLALFMLLPDKRQSLRLPSRARVFLCGAGAFLAFDFMCWNRSVHLVGPGLSTMLGNLQVFFTALFCMVFLGQKPGRLFLASIPLALVGLTAIAGVNFFGLSGDYRLGVVLGISTAMLYSGYILCIKEAMRHREVSGVSAMFMVSLAAGSILAAVMVGRGESFVIPDGRSLLALLGAGLLSSTLGWSLISSAIRHIPATLAGLILLLQPALAFVWDVWLFSRPTSAVELFGVGLILLSIYLGSLSGTR